MAGLVTSGAPSVYGSSLHCLINRVRFLAWSAWRKSVNLRVIDNTSVVSPDVSKSGSERLPPPHFWEKNCFDSPTLSPFFAAYSLFGSPVEY